MRYLWVICVALLWPVALLAQAPTCTPTATFTYLGATTLEAEESESYSGSAPVLAEFKANPSNLGDYSARYTWYFIDATTRDTLFTRNEEETSYTFQKSGSFVVELRANFDSGTDMILYPEEGEEPVRFNVSIPESKLEMPNAFSPNGDEYNEIYRAKDTHQSIVKFRATIFNRWGQRLYSWDNVNGGWDGKVNGKVVKDGVYFVNVEALGADGREYRIRKDVNVLTRKVENGGTGTSAEE